MKTSLGPNHRVTLHSHPYMTSHADTCKMCPASVTKIVTWFMDRFHQALPQAS